MSHTYEVMKKGAEEEVRVAARQVIYSEAARQRLEVAVRLRRTAAARRLQAWWRGQLPPWLPPPGAAPPLPAPTIFCDTVPPQSCPVSGNNLFPPP